MAYVDKEKMKIYNANQQQKFKRYTGKVEKEIAEQFDKKLKENNIKFSYWLKNNIKRYLENL
jgi:hypothetical protein